jgi:hypothetical protein
MRWIGFIFLFSRISVVDGFYPSSIHARSLPLTVIRSALLSKLNPLEERENMPVVEKENPVIVRGSKDDDLPTELWDDIESGQPSQLQVMQKVSLR